MRIYGVKFLLWCDMSGQYSYDAKSEERIEFYKKSERQEWIDRVDYLHSNNNFNCNLI